MKGSGNKRFQEERCPSRGIRPKPPTHCSQGSPGSFTVDHWQSAEAVEAHTPDSSVFSLPGPCKPSFLPLTKSLSPSAPFSPFQMDFSPSAHSSPYPGLTESLRAEDLLLQALTRLVSWPLALLRLCTFASTWGGLEQETLPSGESRAEGSAQNIDQYFTWSLAVLAVAIPLSPGPLHPLAYSMHSSSTWNIPLTPCLTISSFNSSPTELKWYFLKEALSYVST